MQAFPILSICQMETMKKILSLLLFIVISTGCLADEPMNTVIDASSDKAMKESLRSLNDSLSKEQLDKFNKASNANMLQAMMPLIFSDSAKEEIEKAIRKTFDGKTPNEIIAIHAKSGEKDNEDIDDINDIGALINSVNKDIKLTADENTMKKQSLQKIKLGESIIVNEIEIKINRISINKLTDVEKTHSFYVTPKDKFLLVSIILKNQSWGKIFYIQKPWKKTFLVDNFDNIFDSKDIDQYSIAESVIGSKPDSEALKKN